MSNSPAATGTRKTKRQRSFDSNRSTPQIVREQSEYSTPAQSEEEMSQQGEQIRDLSGTIMSGGAKVSQGGNPLPSDRQLQGTSRQAEDERGQAALRQMVEQSVGYQMVEMKRVIADLTSTVGKLSMLVHQTQQDQKKIMENGVPGKSKAVKESSYQWETSEMPVGDDQSSGRSSVVSREVYRQVDKPRVDKWGLEFDGDQNKLAVEDFVFRVESLQRRYGVAWREVLDKFHLLVKGPAERWYWLFIQTNYVTEWNTLKQALLKQYQATRSSFELMRDMVERRQLPGETIDAFFFAMMQLRSRLTMSMPEAEMIKMIKKNLRESIGRIVYPMTVSSVEELRTCCLDAEKTFLRKDLKTNQAPINRFTRQVNEMYNDCRENYQIEEHHTDEIAEIRSNQTNNQTARTLNCWNCHQDGHAFMDCPSEERNIFCYKCGKPDVISPNCANCRRKHFQKNEGRAGDHRSTANPQ